MRKQELLILKAIIKGLAAEGTRSHKFIKASSGKTRARHWDEKRSIGKEARYYLLAYGLLRGVPYEVIEPNSNKDMLSKYNFSYNSLALICQRYCPWLEKSVWTPTSIERLMKTGTMSIPCMQIPKVAS